MLRLVLLAMLLSIGIAHAGEARMIDFSTVIKGPDGPFKDCKKQDDTGKCIEFVDLTLGRLCIIAAGQPDRAASVVDQVAHGKLAMKIVDAKALELSIDEIKFLKDQIGKTGYSPIAVYQAVRILDPTVDK